MYDWFEQLKAKFSNFGKTICAMLLVVVGAIILCLFVIQLSPAKPLTDVANEVISSTAAMRSSSEEN